MRHSMAPIQTKLKTEALFLTLLPHKLLIPKFKKYARTAISAFQSHPKSTLSP